VLALHGRLAFDTVPSLEPMLVGLLVDQARLVVDLSQVAVCDTAGAELLAGAARMARERGGELRLAAPSASVCPWLLAAQAMADVAVFTSVDGAMAADELDLVAPAPCIDALAPWPAPDRAFGARRPQWSVRSAARARSRRGPASRRR
jgi:ABC-type transporter Mla MlaB component